MNDWAQIKAPHYTAGLRLADNVCVEAAPILRWAVGKTWQDLAPYFANKGFEVELTTHQAVMVTGARDLADEEIVALILNTLQPTRVIVGDCPTGADLHARLWCWAHSMKPDVHKADWVQYGRAAGPLRNARLVEAARVSGAMVLAFPRSGPGTQDCINQARAADLVVELF